MSLIDDIKKIKGTEKENRDFSRVIGTALLILGGLFLWRGRPWAPASFLLALIFLAAGQWKPKSLTYPYRFWMGLSLCLGFVVSRIVLSILFYLVLSPIAVISRWCGKTYLDTRFHTEDPSYWILKEQTVRNQEFYERQF